MGVVIVKDGIYYAVALSAAAVVVWWLAGAWFTAPLWLVALFCLYFFRDPERDIPPDEPGARLAVAPADGRVVNVRTDDAAISRVSIFLNIFDVHVNRAPIAGTVCKVEYQKGRFLVASREEASSQNEQNSITIQGDGTVVLFKQIAGLIARRIVCWKKAGDRVKKGERVGLIKFGSRVDILFGPEWEIAVRPGMRVLAGSSVIARCPNLAKDYGA
jgi:phosphatidylserine decarboxylase